MNKIIEKGKGMEDIWPELLTIAIMIIVIGSLLTAIYFADKNADKKCQRYGQEWSHIGSGVYESYKCVNNDGQIRGLK